MNVCSVHQAICVFSKMTTHGVAVLGCKSCIGVVSWSGWSAESRVPSPAKPPVCPPLFSNTARRPLRTPQIGHHTHRVRTRDRRERVKKKLYFRHTSGGTCAELINPKDKRITVHSLQRGRTRALAYFKWRRAPAPRPVRPRGPTPHGHGHTPQKQPRRCSEGEDVVLGVG